MKHTGVLFLLTGLCSAAFARSELTVYAYPSRHGLEWRSPRSLLKSVIHNSLSHDTHAIGHMNVELTCDAQPPDFVGTTSRDPDGPKHLITKEGLGFGVLFVDMPGRFFSSAEIRPEIAERKKAGTLSFLRVAIPDQTCAKLADYLKEYRAKGYDKHYGLPNRPRHREGAGCSAFAASFLEIAGLMPDSVAKQWRRTLDVGEDLIGGPGTGHTISPASILLRPRFTHWTEPSVAFRRTTFWDPELAHGWIMRQWDTGGSFPGLPTVRVLEDRAKGLVVDAASIPTPKDPAFSVLSQ